MSEIRTLGPFEPNDVYRLALYSDESVPVAPYSPAGEVSGQGYEPGGRVVPRSRWLINLKGAETREMAFLADAVRWPRSTLAARSCLLYNASQDNWPVWAHTFDKMVRSTNGAFIVGVPPLLFEMAAE